MVFCFNSPGRLRHPGSRYPCTSPLQLTVSKKDWFLCSSTQGSFVLHGLRWTRKGSCPCGESERPRKAADTPSLESFLKGRWWSLFAVSRTQEVKTCLQTQISPLWLTQHRTNEFTPNSFSVVYSQIVWTQCGELKVCDYHPFFAGRTDIFTNHTNHPALCPKCRLI